MGFFGKKETKQGGIISSDEDVAWHIENLDDKNQYVIVRSKLTDFSGSQFLKRVNTLIQSGYIPQGGASSDNSYTYQSLFRNK